MWVLCKVSSKVSTLWIDIYQNEYFLFQQKIKEITQSTSATNLRLPLRESRGEKRRKPPKPFSIKFPFPSPVTEEGLDPETNCEYRIITNDKYPYKSKKSKYIVALANEIQDMHENHWTILEGILKQAEMINLTWKEASSMGGGGIAAEEMKKVPFFEFVLFRTFSLAVTERRETSKGRKRRSGSMESPREDEGEKSFDRMIAKPRRNRRNSNKGSGVGHFLDDQYFNLALPISNHPIISPRFNPSERGGKNLSKSVDFPEISPRDRKSPLIARDTTDGNTKVTGRTQLINVTNSKNRFLSFSKDTNSISSSSSSSSVSGGGGGIGSGQPVTAAKSLSTPSSIPTSEIASSSSSGRKFSLPRLKFSSLFKGDNNNNVHEEKKENTSKHDDFSSDVDEEEEDYLSLSESLKPKSSPLSSSAAATASSSSSCWAGEKDEQKLFAFAFPNLRMIASYPARILLQHIDEVTEISNTSRLIIHQSGSTMSAAGGVGGTSSNNSSSSNSTSSSATSSFSGMMTSPAMVGPITTYINHSLKLFHQLSHQKRTKLHFLIRRSTDSTDEEVDTLEGTDMAGFLYITDENLCFVASGPHRFLLKFHYNELPVEIPEIPSFHQFKDVILFKVDARSQHFLFHSIQNVLDLLFKIAYYRSQSLQLKHEAHIKSQKAKSSPDDTSTNTRRGALTFFKLSSSSLPAHLSKTPLFSVFSPLPSSSNSIDDVILHLHEEIFPAGSLIFNDRFFTFISRSSSSSTHTSSSSQSSSLSSLMVSIPYHSIVKFEYQLTSGSIDGNYQPTLHFFSNFFPAILSFRFSSISDHVLKFLEIFAFTSSQLLFFHCASLPSNYLPSSSSSNSDDEVDAPKLSSFEKIEKMSGFFTSQLIGSTDDPIEKMKLQYWKNYCTTFGGSVSLLHSSLLQQLIRLGIPNSLRRKVWKKVFGAYQKKRKINTEELGYDYFGNAELQTKYSQVPYSVISEIEVDIYRTLPEHPYFQDNNGAESLKRLLTAFAWRNPLIGYCQSMNIISSLLLLFLSENEAFEFLCLICEEVLPMYYTPTMEGALIDQQVLRSLMEEYLPSVHNHLTKNEVPIAVITLPWFLCIFIKTIPWDATLRVLDIFFSEGRKVLFQIALAIFKIYEKNILDLSDSIEVIFMLKENIESITADNLFQVAFGEFEITNEQIDKLWKYHCPQIFKELRQKFLLNDIKNIKPSAKTSSSSSSSSVTSSSSFFKHKTKSKHGKDNQSSSSSSSTSSLPDKSDRNDDVNNTSGLGGSLLSISQPIKQVVHTSSTPFYSSPDLGSAIMESSSSSEMDDRNRAIDQKISALHRNIAIREKELEEKKNKSNTNIHIHLPPLPSPLRSQNPPIISDGEEKLHYSSSNNNNNGHIVVNNNDNVEDGSGEKSHSQRIQRLTPNMKKRSFQLKQSKLEILKIMSDIEQKKSTDRTSGLFLLIDELLYEDTNNINNINNSNNNNNQSSSEE